MGVLAKEWRFLMSWPKTPEQHGHAIVKLLADQNRELKIGIRLLNSCVHQHFMRKLS